MRKEGHLCASYLVEVVERHDVFVSVGVCDGSPVRLEDLRLQPRVDHRLEAGHAQHAHQLLLLARCLLHAVHDPVRVLERRDDAWSRRTALC